MIKLILLVVFAFVQAAAFTAMPSKCFTVDRFGTCERIFGDALIHNRSINWEVVDVVRTIR